MPFPHAAIRKHSSEESAVAGRYTEDCPKPSVTPHPAFSELYAHRWGVILAGGDGTRLRELTRMICGDDRPKQFCPLTGEDTLFEQTRKRVQQLIPSRRLLVPLTESHSSYYFAEQGIPASQRIVQPSNKGTAPPIIHSLLSIEQQDPDALVAVLPCDHHYEDEPAFIANLAEAFNIAGSRRDSVVLLGASAQGPEVEYGWIQLGECMDGRNFLFAVEGFCEKPSRIMAQRLFTTGALWNTFVMVGHVHAFLGLVEAALPDLLALVQRTTLWSGSELRIPASLYDQIAASDFSREVLSSHPSMLVVLRMERAGWSDLGRAERVMALLQTAGIEPWWIKPRAQTGFEIADAAQTMESEVTCGV